MEVDVQSCDSGGLDLSAAGSQDRRTTRVTDSQQVTGTQGDDISRNNSKQTVDNAVEGDDTSNSVGADVSVGAAPINNSLTFDDNNQVNFDGPSDVTAVMTRTLDDQDQNDEGLNGKKKRHRRRNKGGKHHRKWKPYDKLSWDERKNLEERETRRACQKREHRFASGQAMAPYNTTQFLMEQHEPSSSEFHLDESRPMRDRAHTVSGEVPLNLSGSAEGSSEDFDSNGEEEIFLEKDFTEAYEQFQAERLLNMTKQELIKEHLQLETEVEKLKGHVKGMESESRRSNGSGGSSVPVTPTDGASRSLRTPSTDDSLCLERKIQKLSAENRKLFDENTLLKARSALKDAVSSSKKRSVEVGW